MRWGKRFATGAAGAMMLVLMGMLTAEGWDWCTTMASLTVVLTGPDGKWGTAPSESKGPEWT